MLFCLHLIQIIIICVGEVAALNGIQLAGLPIEQFGLEPWLGSLCCALGQDSLL